MPVRSPDEGPSGERSSEFAVGIQTITEDELSSGEGSSASEIVDLSINEELVVEERHNPKLLRAVARKHEIQSTKSLVVAYNKATDVEERAVLFEWLKKYDERSEEWLRQKAVLEYAELAKIIPRSTQDKDLLKNLVVALCSCLRQGEFLDENSGLALCRALVHVDPSVYGGVEQLVLMANKLLNSLSTEPTLSIRNFREYEATFVSLHLIFFLLNKTRPYGIYEIQKQKFRRTIAEKEKAMELSCKYYPVSFHFKVLLQAVERLELRDAPSYLAQAMRHVSCGLWAFLHLLHFARNPAEGDTNPVAVEDVHMRRQIVIANSGVSKKPWFDPLQNLMASMLDAAKNEERARLFYSNYNTTFEHQRKMKNKEDLKALRFGIICQLSMLATEGASENTCKEAAEKLADLAARETSPEGWTKDVDMFIAFLDGIHKLHSTGQRSEKTEKGFQVLHQFGKGFAKEVLAEWLDGESMENKFRIRSQRWLKVEHNDLCIIVGREVGYIPLAVMKLKEEELKKRYLCNDFATVNSLFGDRGCLTHVKDMKHHVVISEEIIEERRIKPKQRTEEVIRGAEETERKSSNRRRDQAKEHYEKKRRVTRPIALNDLFERRSLKSGDPESEVQRVLLYGNPGSGKTCIAKIIAHKWALGEMAQEFETVYVVPVGVLNGTGSKGQQWTSLEEAISRICFSKRNRAFEYEDLALQIEDALDDRSTLLVVDGLDETNDNARELVSTTWERSCKVLFLSRPYNMRNVETRVDVQVECLGFNDEQLRDYIRSELPDDEAQRLTRSLENTAAMWEMAHIPMMTHILCSLSKEHGMLLEKGRRVNTFRIYRDMTNCVWKRFEEKPVAQNTLKPKLLEDLEKIAFETLQNGQILIRERSVIEHSTSKNAAKSFKESGLLLLSLEGQEYHFPHLTFQQYFAGRYIARNLKQKGSDEEVRVIDFIHEVKYAENHARTLTFAMHAFAEGRSEQALKELLSIIDKQPAKVPGMQHDFLRIRALEATIQEVDEADLETLIKDEQAIEVAEDACRLLKRTIDNVPAGQIVVEKFEQTFCVLDRFPRILNTIIEDVKRLLKSTKDLSKNDDIKMTHALMLAKRWPKYIKDVIQSFLKDMSRVQDRCFLRESLRRFELISAAAPQYVGDMLLLLGRWRANDTFGMRQRATEILKNIAFEAPEHASRMLPMLKRACGDEDVIIRMEAMKAIESVVEAAPRLAGDIFAMLEEACVDGDSGVRRISVKAIKSVVEAAPHLAGEIRQILKKGCADEDAGVRRISIKAIESVVEATSQLADDMFSILETGCDDEMVYVRETVMETIGNVVRAAPHLASDMLPMLGNGVNDENVVVVVKAMKAIESVVEAAPHLAKDVLPILKSACADEKSYVRERVMEAIGNVIGVASHIADDMLLMLKRGCCDEVIYVREKALEAIRKKVVGTAPHLASDMLTLLENETGEEYVAVRMKAIEIIESVAGESPRSASDVPLMTERDSDDELFGESAFAKARRTSAFAKARRTPLFPEEDRLILSTIALLPPRKKGLLYFLVRNPLLSILFAGADEEVLFFACCLFEEIERFERKSLSNISGV